MPGKSAAQPRDTATLSARPLDQLLEANAATWVDRELSSQSPLPIRDAGFGREVRAAMSGRQQWLVEQQLADVDGDRIRLRASAIMMLQRRELLHAGDRLAGELGKPFVKMRAENAIEGRLLRHVDLVSGRFALVEKNREFTLIPWRAVLDRHVGQDVTAIIQRGGQVNWQFGRGKKLDIT